jgi:glycosyltransferase involved in cell wall biosynthesis
MMPQAIVITINDDKCESDLIILEGDNRRDEGGLRTQGYLKKSSDYKPLISIITVVFNDEKHLEQTIQSVLNQRYDNVEYIIIDGRSTDGTLDIIKKYEEQLDYWISEKDTGIYDAMNKGIELVTGNWINFMNGGDTFYNDDVLSNVYSELKDEFMVVSGYVSIHYKNDYIENYGNKNIIPHQAAFFKSFYMKSLQFNLEYFILADGELLRRLQNLQDYHAKYVDITIAKFYLGGIGNHPKFFFKRVQEELKMRSLENQSISLKWIFSQLYNLLGWLFYKIFGEDKFFKTFQKKTLSLLKKFK